MLNHTVSERVKIKGSKEWVKITTELDINSHPVLHSHWLPSITKLIHDSLNPTCVVAIFQASLDWLNQNFRSSIQEFPSLMHSDTQRNLTDQ